MKEFCLYPSAGKTALTKEEIQKSVDEMVSTYKGSGKRLLLIVPDYTRYQSCAGLIANTIYHALADCQVDLLQALGTHAPMTREECRIMYGDIPFEKILPHNWKKDVVKIGEIPAELAREVSQGILEESICVEVNRLVVEGGYDEIISIGQVVPHEIVGMANQSKNIFVGVGGSGMIDASHALGAFYGMERIMGRDKTPVRILFDYALENFLSHVPITFVLTVTTADNTDVTVHGVFGGADRSYFEKAVALAQTHNLAVVEKPVKKMVVYLDPAKFKSTWLGNKAIYRTRMAIADGGELVVLAAGVERFGEDDTADALIRKYGYCGLNTVNELRKTQKDMQENMSATAHLVHGSTDGRFQVTYCTQKVTKEEVESVCFQHMPYEEAIKTYDPHTLQDGWNQLPNGEEFYYISNPALGLWKV